MGDIGTYALRLALLFTALGIGTLLSALTVAYRDFRYVLPFLVQLWLSSDVTWMAPPAAPSFWMLPQAPPAA